MENKLLKINTRDDVAVALSELKAGTTVREGENEITVLDDIPFGHKVALHDISTGENIIKYGYPIGHATADIKKGAHIHVQNLKTNLSGELKYEYNKKQYEIASKDFSKKTFMGYKRPDGRTGIRNEIWIIPTVGCVNQTAKLLAEEAGRRFSAENFDGFHAYTHNMGCSQLNPDQETTQKLLAGIINNPNAAAVLVLSLGCENNNLDIFTPYLGDFDKNRIRFLVTQDSEDEYEDGIKLLNELFEYAVTFKREPVPASELVIGFKCGGSDAFSGITANALCGRICDALTAAGGKTMLTEVPEMFGAETILMERAESKEVFDNVVSLINNFKGYYTRYGQTIYENPSPGNKKGGISSLEEKSLGCIQKGGNATVTGVLDFGEQIVKPGLNLLIGPGNDQVSCTNLVASGAQMVLFTTGRGNPFGSPVPTVKISSNSILAQKKSNWIDFNAGVLLEGISFEDATEQLFDYLLSVAGGEQTKNEKNDYRDISVFRDGVIL